jgi:DNA-directed RNA polymerase subunit RPC12/RpoP
MPTSLARTSTLPSPQESEPDESLASNVYSPSKRSEAIQELTCLKCGAVNVIDSKVAGKNARCVQCQFFFGAPRDMTVLQRTTPSTIVNVMCYTCAAEIALENIGSSTTFQCPDCHEQHYIAQGMTQRKACEEIGRIPPQGKSEWVKCEKCNSCETIVSDGKTLTYKCRICSHRWLIYSGMLTHKNCSIHSSSREAIVRQESHPAPLPVSSPRIAD